MMATQTPSVGTARCLRASGPAVDGHHGCGEATGWAFGRGIETAW